LRGNRGSSIIAVLALAPFGALGCSGTGGGGSSAGSSSAATAAPTGAAAPGATAPPSAAPPTPSPGVPLVGGPADPSAAGPYSTTQVTLNVTTAGQSSTIDVRMPVAPTTPRPLVVINHGWLSTTALYTTIADHLASRGFVAALFQQPNITSTSTPDWSTQLRGAIDALVNASSGTGSLAGAIDTTRIGVMGHSYGGATVIYATGDDPRIKTCVALAPVNQFWSSQIEAQAAKIAVPFHVEAAQDDVLAIPAIYPKPFYDAATQAPSKLYIEIAGASHSVFCDTAVGSAPFVTFQQFSTAWLEHFLAGNPDPAGWTDGTMAQQDLTAGSLSDVH